MSKPRTAPGQLGFDFDVLEPLLRVELPELAVWTDKGYGVRIIPPATDGRVAELLDVSRRTVQRWRHGTWLSSRQADRAATALHLHPSQIWERWDVVHDDVARRRGVLVS